MAWFGSRSDEKRSRAILDAAAAGGITFLDTADVYGASKKTRAASSTEKADRFGCVLDAGPAQAAGAPV
jgi:aryl-alcohol dehydrogenase-like predicted oxidoreductase